MTGPQVALVHGFGTSFEATWVGNGWAALLADAGRTVIGVDLLGHGTAEKPTDPDDYRNLEQRVLDVLPPEPVDGIGFSMGAQVLLWLAAHHSDRFGRLVVSGIGRNLFESDVGWRPYRFVPLRPFLVAIRHQTRKDSGRSQRPPGGRSGRGGVRPAREVLERP
ncbi:MAG: alpha/beta hydrolase, partial [Acidimicrobiales bacterium]|nr:alpha/beta hydrolase [Acidimicrobiales bacterium]